MHLGITNPGSCHGGGCPPASTTPWGAGAPGRAIPTPTTSQSTGGCREKAAGEAVRNKSKIYLCLARNTTSPSLGREFGKDGEHDQALCPVRSGCRESIWLEGNATTGFGAAWKEAKSQPAWKIKPFTLESLPVIFKSPLTQEDNLQSFWRYSAKFSV